MKEWGKMIRLNKIKKSYFNKEVLNIEKLDINNNELTVILGNSGSGKTTLLNIIGTIDNPDSGTLNLINDGKTIDVFLKKEEYRANNLGFIFQDFNLIDGMNIYENILVGNLYSKKETFLPNDIISYLNMDNKKQSVSQLSGGEKQRIAVARAISKDADIILADEPTGNLDSTNSNKVFELLKKISKNKIVIISTHNEELAQKYADRIIRIKDGIIIEDKRNLNEHKLDDFEKTSFIKTKENNKVKAFFLVARNSIKKNFLKMISSIFLLALSISAIVSFFNINNSGNKISKKVNKNYLETDLLNIYYESSRTSSKEKPIDLEIIKTQLKGVKTNQIVGIYNMNDYYLYKENKALKISTKNILLNDFFKERVLSNEIIGNFPEKENEVIISSDAAIYFFNDINNCIGQNLKLGDGSGNTIEVLISGVNLTQNPQNEIYCFINDKLSYELKKEELKSTKNLEIEKIRYFNKDEPLEDRKAVKGQIKIINSNNEINLKEGKLPNYIKEKIEIIVPKNQIDYYYNAFGIDKDDQNGLEKLSNLDLGFYLNGLNKIKIVGIHDEENFVFILEDNFNDIIDPKYISAEVYLENINDSEKITQKINDNENDDLFAISNYKNLRLGVVKNTIFFQIALIFLGILLLLISMTMINSLVKFMIYRREKEISILKSLGASNLNVFITLLADVFFIILCAFILSIILVLTIYFMLPMVFVEFKIIEFSFPITLIFIVSLIYLFLATLISFFPIYRISKKPPYTITRK